MFSQYEPNVKAAITFLKQLNVKVNESTVNETLQNHPDWPSLLCITDSLHKWNIPNGVGKIDLDKIDELPTPFIAHTNDRENPLAIVKEVTANNVHIFQKKYNQLLSVSREEFLKQWQGVYLIAEPNNQSGELHYKAAKRKAFLNSLIPAASFLVLLLLATLFLIESISNIPNSTLVIKIGIYFQYFITVAGIVVSSLLLWYEIDKNNPLLQKVCTGIAKGDCNAILTGKQAKVFSWLSWSEVGFFYFTGALLVLLFSGNSISNAIGLIGWLNILALPYTAFSIYYQWRIARQWCVLCLAVQALLLLGGANIIFNNFLFTLTNLSYSAVCTYFLLLLLPTLLWFAVKPYILKLQEAKNTKREYLRIKFNTQIFETLLKKQKAISVSSDGLGIDIGNPAASNTIIKVCNPYCGPCAKAHPKIEALLKQNNNVKATIIFTTPNNESDKGYGIVRHLLAIAERNEETKTKKSLDDWYLTETKDYNVFEKKYPMNGELLKQGAKMDMMEKWCKQMDITSTPTIFINGQQLPDAYSIEDLQYFLLE